MHHYREETLWVVRDRLARNLLRFESLALPIGIGLTLGWALTVFSSATSDLGLPLWLVWTFQGPVFLAIAVWRPAHRRIGIPWGGTWKAPDPLLWKKVVWPGVRWCFQRLAEDGQIPRFAEIDCDVREPTPDYLHVRLVLHEGGNVHAISFPIPKRIVWDLTQSLQHWIVDSPVWRVPR